jgi:hypothetical protein
METEWKRLLYDADYSAVAAEGMVGALAMSKRLLWTEDEEAILKRESRDNMNNFHLLLDKYRPLFHSSRTSKSLEAHYYRMKKSGDLSGTSKSVSRTPQTEGTKTETAPDERNGAATTPRSMPSMSDLMAASTRPLDKMDFRSMEAAAVMQSLAAFGSAVGTVDSHSSNVLSPPSAAAAVAQHLKSPGMDEGALKEAAKEKKKLLLAERDFAAEETRGLDNRTLAVLRGTRLRAYMRTREIVLGRASENNNVDIDLADEGPASRVSRRHIIITVRNDGSFYLINIGKRTVYLNGRPVLAGHKTPIDHNSVIELCDLRLVFFLNMPMITQFRKEIE